MKIINKMTLMKFNGFIEKTFVTIEGYYGVVAFNQGYREGYVAVPKNHCAVGELSENWIQSLKLDYTGTCPHFFKTLELKEHLQYFGFRYHKGADDIDVEMLHNLGIPGFKTKVNGPNVKTLAFVIEKINGLSAQLTPQAIMEYKMRTINNQN